MSNVVFDITGEGEEVLSHALAIAFAENPHAFSWTTEHHESIERLILSWRPSPCAGWTRLLSPVDAKRAVQLVGDWLANADYGDEPDDDGSNNQGWRVYTDRHGYVEPHYAYSFVAIEPVWIAISK